MIILLVNLLIKQINNRCAMPTDQYQAILPRHTEIMWWILEHHLYFVFSLISIAIILFVPLKHLKRMSVETIILGVHLLIVAFLFFAFSAPFMPMCEKID